MNGLHLLGLVIASILLADLMFKDGQFTWLMIRLISYSFIRAIRLIRDIRGLFIRGYSFLRVLCASVADFRKELI